MFRVHLLLCVFLLQASLFAFKDQQRQISKHDVRTARMIRNVEGKGILEITSNLLNASFVDEEAKKKIKKQNRKIFLFEYPSDGKMIKGYISYVPSSEKKSLLVYLRGGAQVYRITSPAHRTSLLHDYTVISTTYRGGINRGHDEWGGADVNDVNALIEYIPTLEKQLGISIDGGKRYLLGWSRGGMQMFLALARFPHLQSYFDKVVSISGVLDFQQFLRDRPDLGRMIEFGLGIRFDKKKIDARNAVFHVNRYDKTLPTLLVQGTEDTMVHTRGGYSMLKRLKKRGARVDYLEVEGGDHCLKNRPGVLDIVIEWLES